MLAGDNFNFDELRKRNMMGLRRPRTLKGPPFAGHHIAWTHYTSTPQFHTEGLENPSNMPKNRRLKLEP
jgi:hypothetical protein